MKQKRFAEEAIIRILNEGRRAESTLEALCAAHNIAVKTYYRWKRKYGDMDVPQARRLKALEENLRRQEKIIADLSVENQILKEVNAKKW